MGGGPPVEVGSRQTTVALAAGYADGMTAAEALRREFNNPQSSDMRFSVDGKHIHVHKAVLKIRCGSESGRANANANANAQVRYVCKV